LTDCTTSVHTNTNAVRCLEAEVTSTCPQRTIMVPLIKQRYCGCDWLWSVNV